MIPRLTRHGRRAEVVDHAPAVYLKKADIEVGLLFPPRRSSLPSPREVRRGLRQARSLVYRMAKLHRLASIRGVL